MHSMHRSRVVKSAVTEEGSEKLEEILRVHRPVTREVRDRILHKEGI